MNQIIFITDGEPNNGERNTKRIISNVRDINNLKNIDKYNSKISIFSFGVGTDCNDSSWINDLNHSFLKLLSLNNNGFYKRIKQSNTDTLLTQYFNILSKPVLSNINIKYKNKNIKQMTETKFHSLYSGNDIIICGKIDHHHNVNHNEKQIHLDLIITATTGKEIKNEKNDELITKPIDIYKEIKINIYKENDNNHKNNNIERIWAYLKLKQFAKNELIYNDIIEVTHDEKKNDDALPLALAIKYKFVTPWTSMIVVKKKDEITKPTPMAPPPQQQQHQNATHSYPTPIMAPPPPTRSAVKLEDSCMANYGSEEHKEIKKDIISQHKAWDNVGAENGLQIWRIDIFKVKNWPKDRYGQFYGSDSYIILHTMENDEGKKHYDVFFWLGAETSQDEAEVGAYKTVELDDYLGDELVQYREVQGNESKKFLELFPKVTILAGGVDSGFKNVKPKDYKPRLLHITGFKKHVQVYQIGLDSANLNNSGVFVLDGGLTIFQFNGSKSSEWEKRKANGIVDELQASRHGKVKTILIIDGLEDSGNPLIDDFWAYFGGKPKEIKAEEEEKKVPDYTLSLHHISDDFGVMEINEVCSGQLDKSKLDSNDAFILDAGCSLFVWVGKGANKAQKRESMAYAIRYLTDQGRSTHVPIARVSQGKEPKEFWDAFGEPII